MCVKPGNVLLSLACFKNNFADVEFLVYGLFLSALWMYHLNAFWPPWFVMWNQLLISCKIPFTQVILFTAFSVLLVSFNSLLMIYIILGSYSLLIELLRYVNEFFKTNLEVLCHYLFKYYFFPFICLLANWDTHYTDTDMLDNVSVLPGSGHFFPAFSSVPQAGQS